MPTFHSVFVSLALAAISLIATNARAGDWPQILGPQRNGRADGERIVAAFPSGGPRLVWQKPVGSGFSGVAVTDGLAVLFHRLGDEEIVEGLDAKTGDSRWKAVFPTDYRPSFTSDNGPRCVPVIDGRRVFVFGAKGDLHCLKLQDGKSIWSRDTFRDFPRDRLGGEPPEGYFGIGSTPIVVGERLLVNVGGASANAGIVAFSVKDGKTLWKATDTRMSYSSPAAGTVDGENHAVFVTRFKVVSVDPADGTVHFEFPFGQRGPSATGASPLLLGNHVFVTGSYGFGAVLARIEAGGVQELWRRDDVLSSQYTTCVEAGGKLYGVHGRQDIGAASLRCIEPKSGKVLWSEDGFGYATLIQADGKLIVLKTDGELVLTELRPDRYQELDRARLFSGTTRALPALSGGLFYARDGRTLKCFDLGRGGR